MRQSIGQSVAGIINILFKGSKYSNLQSRLIRSASGSFCLKIAFTGLSFILSVLLARLLGAAGYGSYAYALTWLNLLAIPAALGLDFLLVREIAAYKAQHAWSLAHGLLQWANRTVLLISLGLCLLAALIAWVFLQQVDTQALPVFWVALLSLPLTALTRLRQSTLQGLQHVVAGQVPESLVRPLLLISFLAAAHLLLDGRLSATGCMALYVMATAIAFLIGAYLLRRHLPPPVRAASPEYQVPAWLSSILPMMLLSGIFILSGQISVLLLGALKGTEAVGIYHVAHRGSEFILFGLGAVNVTLSPVAASLFAQGELARLQRIVTRSVQAATLISLPIAIILIVFRQPFLTLFGPEFTKGQTTLIVLSLGQVFNVATGSVGPLLVMTGHERDAVAGILIGVVANAALSLILIPKHGVEGAAAAAAGSMMLWNLLLVARTSRRLGIHCTALGNIKWKGGNN